MSQPLSNPRIIKLKLIEELIIGCSGLKLKEDKTCSKIFWRGEIFFSLLSVASEFNFN